MLRLSYLILLFLLAGSFNLIGETLYSVTDLGTLGGQQSFGYGINSRGQVTGWSQASDGAQHAFLYADGQMRDLNSSEPGVGLTLYAGRSVNDAGQVTGSAKTITGRDHAFVYNNGQISDLNNLIELFPLTTLYPVEGNVALGINNSGQVIGYSIQIGMPWGFLYSNGQITYLEPGHVLPNGINNVGEITGDAGHAFIFSNGQLTDLGTLGGIGSSGTSINNAGQVTGSSFLSEVNGLACCHAFLYSNGEMTDLGTLGGSSEGLGINGSAQVVGDYQLATGARDAFVYSNGQMMDLNALIDPALSISLSTARAINDHGQIVANSSSRTYLLTPLPTTPVPEPSTLAVFGLVLLGLAAFKRRGLDQCSRRARSNNRA